MKTAKKTLVVKTKNDAADLALLLKKEPAAMVKAIYTAQERRYYAAADLVEKLTAEHAADLADMDSARRRHDADAYAAARARCADLAAAARKLADCEQQFTCALIQLAATRLASVTRRAYDPHAAHAADIDATENQIESARDSACSPVILDIRREAPATVNGALLTAAAADFYDADRITDAADVLSTAALAILDTRADRAAAVARAAVDWTSALDYAYKTDGDGEKRRPACAITRANRAAERYINGRRGLRAADFRTVYIEDLTPEQDGREAEAIYKRAGVYASLSHDGYISGVTVENVESMLAALNLTATERRRVWRYVSGLSVRAVAAAENVTERAAAKSINAAREKVLAALNDAARRAADGGNTNRAGAFDHIAADLAAVAAAAENNEKAAPVYTSDYVPTLTPPAVAVAVNACRAALAALDENASKIAWDVAAYGAKKRADAARAALNDDAAAARRAAALDRYTPADIDARRAAARAAVLDLSDHAAARRAAAAEYNAAAAAAADLADKADAAEKEASAACRALYIAETRRRFGLPVDYVAALDAAADADAAARRAYDAARRAAARAASAADKLGYIDALKPAARATFTPADHEEMNAAAAAVHDRERAAAVAVGVAVA